MMPQSRIWGTTTAGRNCTAWNSVRANALTKSPSAVPSTASATATTTSSHIGPATSSPSTVRLAVTANADWTIATSPKARA